jgi:hypothetical protein
MDGGTLLDKRRSVQATADAAALAAAADLWDHYSANNGLDPAPHTAQASAVSTATANGFVDGVNSTVTVNVPPLTSANFNGKAGYVEVIITYNQPGGFSSIWNSAAVPVKAHAVAGGNPGNVGILMLDLHKRIMAQIGDNVNILNGGAIFINSDATVNGDINEGNYAIYLESTAHLTTGGIYTVGPLGREAGSTITYTNGGSLNTGVSPLPDPLASIPEPVVPSGPNFGNKTYAPPKGSVQTFHMSPGIYGDVQIKTGATVIMDAGIYYVHGGSMTLAAGTTVTGSDVMFYDMPNNYFDVPATASVNVGAPSSGTYRGISVFEPRDITNEIHIITDGSITLSGALYAQAGEFDLRPQLATTVYTFGAYICDQAEWGPPPASNSLGTIILNPSSSAPTKRPLLIE